MDEAIIDDNEDEVVEVIKENEDDRFLVMYELLLLNVFQLKDEADELDVAGAIDEDDDDELSDDEVLVVVVLATVEELLLVALALLAVVLAPPSNVV